MQMAKIQLAYLLPKILKRLQGFHMILTYNNKLRLFDLVFKAIVIYIPLRQLFYLLMK
jgi:hypothetical protein